MSSKPRQFHERYASIFQDASVVGAYPLRPPYPEETFRILLSLIPPDLAAAAVLDAGCGTGSIARPLAAWVDRVDAVDISERMIALAKTLPGGDRPNLHWIHAPIETAPLSGSYALVVAAASLHWMDWERTLPRFAELLIPRGRLVLVDEIQPAYPWNQAAAPIIRRYSLNQDFAPYNLETVARELEQRGLFRLEGQTITLPVPFRQPLADYIRSYHARNGFSLDRMDPQAAAQFDAALRAAVAPFCPDGWVTLQISAGIWWGQPAARRGQPA